MKNSFPKCDKRYFKEWVCNANANFGEIVLEKSVSYMKSSFSKCVKHQSKQIESYNANAKFGESVLEKSASYI